MIDKETLEWLQYQLQKTSRMIAKIPEGSLEVEIPTPIATMVWFDDMRHTYDRLSSPYLDIESGCRIPAIQQKIDNEERCDADYFYAVMHIVVHCAINTHFPELENDDLVDIAILENIAVLSTLLMCKRYLGLVEPTIYMTKILIACTMDLAKVLKGEDEEVYTEMHSYLHRIFDILISVDSKTAYH
jgi:hypothetical protein